MEEPEPGCARLGHHAVLKPGPSLDAVGAVAQQSTPCLPCWRRPLLHAVDLRVARLEAYHRVHAELGHVLLALGPRGVHALQRAPQRGRVHVAPRGVLERSNRISPPVGGAPWQDPCASAQITKDAQVFLYDCTGRPSRPGAGPCTPG